MAQTNSRGEGTERRGGGGGDSGEGDRGGRRPGRGWRRREEGFEEGGRLPGPRASSTAGAPGGPCVL